MTAPVNAAAIEAACKAYSDTAINTGSNGLEEDITAALTAALPFLRAEWETELRAVVKKYDGPARQGQIILEEFARGGDIRSVERGTVENFVGLHYQLNRILTATTEPSNDSTSSELQGGSKLEVHTDATLKDVRATTEPTT